MSRPSALRVSIQQRVTARLADLNGYSALERFILLVFALLFAGYFCLRASPQRDILYAATPFLIYYIAKHRTSIAHGRVLWWALGCYGLYNLASVLWSPQAGAMALATYARYELMAALFTAGLAALLARHPDAWRFLVTVYVGAAFIAAIVIAGLYAGKLSTAHHFIRLEGTGRGVNSNICAAFYATAILFILYWRARRPDRPIPLSRTLVFLLGLFALIVVLTMGRGPLLALLATILIMTLVQRRWRMAAGMIAAYALVAAFVFLNPADWGDIVKRGDDNRFDLWRQAFAIVRAHPLFGTGVANELDFYAPYAHQHFNSTHDAYLGAVVYGGAVGLVMLLALLAAILAQSWRLYRTGVPIAFALSIYGLIYFLFEAHTLVLNVNPEWLFYLLPAALAIGLAKRRESSILTA